MQLTRLVFLSAVFSLAGLALSLPCAAQPAAQVINREMELKGKLVGLLAAKYVTWPRNVAPARGKPLTVTIVGDSPISTNALKQVVPTAEIVNLAAPNAAQFKKSHIVVAGNNVNFDAVIKEAKDLPVLIVSAAPGLAEKGATMNLVYYPATNLIRLEFNPKTAKQANINVHPLLPKSSFVDIVQ